MFIHQHRAPGTVRWEGVRARAHSLEGEAEL